MKASPRSNAESARLDVNARKILRTLALFNGVNPEELVGCLDLPTSQVDRGLNNLKAAGLVKFTYRGVCLDDDRIGAVLRSEMSARERRVISRQWLSTLMKSSSDLERLAELAMSAGAWGEACGFLFQLAKNASDSRNSAALLKYYSNLSACRRRARTQIEVSDEIRFAECFMKAGHFAAGGRIYRKLVGYVNSSGSKDDWTIIQDSLSRLTRKQLVDRPLKFSHGRAQENDPLLNCPARLAQRSTAFVTQGDIQAAESMLHQAALKAGIEQQHSEFEVRLGFAFLEMNKANFWEALKTFRRLDRQDSAKRAAIRTNIAVCLEHLGRVRAAYRVQLRAYDVADRSGHVLGGLCCLANLSTFALKLGDLDDARAHFQKARSVADGRNEPRLRSLSERLLDGEEAQLSFMEGKYSLAFRQIRAALKSPGLYASERLGLQIKLYEFLTFVGASNLPPGGLQEVRDAIADSKSRLYETQWAIVQSRLEEPGKASATLLDQMRKAQQSGFVYEYCRLGIEYSRQNADCRNDALIDQLLEWTTRRELNALRAEALLLKSLSAEGHNKAKLLADSYNTASSIGLAELTAESAYYLGMWLMDSGNRPSAKEWLLKSVAILSQLEAGVDGVCRPNYKAVRWRSEATRQLSFLALENPVLWKASDDLAWQKKLMVMLHEITVIVKSAQSPRDFLPALAALLARGLGCGAIIVIHEDATSEWITSGIVLDENLKRRVEDLSAEATAGAKGRQSLAVRPDELWLSLPAPFAGGLYLTSDGFRKIERRFFSVLESVIAGSLQRADNSLRNLEPPATAFCGMVGVSEVFVQLCSRIASLSSGDATVLLEGETGTGKELVARAIHISGPRKDSPFVSVDCGAIPEALFESELFGVTRGAFTGALHDREGLLAAADQGMMFLDEVSNLPSLAQAKLLRVLQERTFRPLGSSTEKTFDVRIVAASNVSLRHLVSQGRFREDLFYRLNGVTLSLPPLRDRIEDVPYLAKHFLNELNKKWKTAKTFADDAVSRLMQHDFPGNIRELKNAVERAYDEASGGRISQIPVEESAFARNENIEALFKRLIEGTEDFWTSIYTRFKARELTPHSLRLLVHLGLRATGGSYKEMASRFHMDNQSYRRLMDFLRRSRCLLDFRPYRRQGVVWPPSS